MMSALTMPYCVGDPDARRAELTNSRIDLEQRQNARINMTLCLLLPKAEVTLSKDRFDLVFPGPL